CAKHHYSNPMDYW
nr:immunoglobulin heavy chain junction region [Mus musculus]NSM04323.1 immunoglobulin heavy chain junction region [Mus musculus]NSM05593.1 immunoglobulin heavy chain junction region [Mus musculus]NSM05606.1 immunoglobulin heavy chain junction region [Mus musculus]